MCPLFPQHGKRILKKLQVHQDKVFFSKNNCLKNLIPKSNHVSTIHKEQKPTMKRSVLSQDLQGSSGTLIHLPFGSKFDHRVVQMSY